MKRRLTILTLLVAALLGGAADGAARPAAASPRGETSRKETSRGETTREERDSLSRKERMAMELIESVNQLSRTASKLGETALELIHHDNGTPRQGGRQQEAAPDAAELRRQWELEERERQLEERERAVKEREDSLQQAIGESIIGRWSAEAAQRAGAGAGAVLSDESDWSDESDESDSARGTVKSDLPGRFALSDLSYLSDLSDLSDPSDPSDKTAPDDKTAPTDRFAPLDRKVLFRGDTLNMVLRDRNFGRFDRKLFNYLAIPRGIWKASLTASYAEISTQDLEMLDLLNNVTLGGYIFSIKPAISYFIRDNIAIGCRLSYSRGHGYVDGFDIDIDDDMNFSLKDIDYQSESYRAGLTLTRYLGLSPRSRFHLTNELELAFASGNSDFQRPYDSGLKHVHTTTMSVAATYSPGVSVVIMRNVCFDLSFGVFGFQLKSERQSVDGVDMGRRTTSGANFRFNIFNLSFGIGVTL